MSLPHRQALEQTFRRPYGSIPTQFRFSGSTMLPRCLDPVHLGEGSSSAASGAKSFEEKLVTRTLCSVEAIASRSEATLVARNHHPAKLSSIWGSCHHETHIIRHDRWTQSGIPSKQKGSRHVSILCLSVLKQDENGSPHLATLQQSSAHLHIFYLTRKFTARL